MPCRVQYAIVIIYFCECQIYLINVCLTSPSNKFTMFDTFNIWTITAAAALYTATVLRLHRVVLSQLNRNLFVRKNSKIHKNIPKTKIWKNASARSSWMHIGGITSVWIEFRSSRRSTEFAPSEIFTIRINDMESLHREQQIERQRSLPSSIYSAWSCVSSNFVDL